MSKECENSESLLKDFVLEYYNRGLSEGMDINQKEWKSKATELQRQNQIKRIMYPVCWLIGHNVDPLWQFCKRCKISRERLMN